MFDTLLSITSNRLLEVYHILLVQRLSAQADNTQIPPPPPPQKENLKSLWKPARKPELQVHLQPGYAKGLPPGHP